jgi:peptidyl-prolyl cis-trans isomerase A (cyclophilin A)
MAKLQISSDSGDFEIHLHEDRAPATCAYFAYLARSGFLNASSIFRIVAPANQRPDEPCPINVVQMGPLQALSGTRHRIKHENTKITGLSHRKWTVSAARFHRQQLYGNFFVCMRDEPSLDFGGARQPDGQGFAAFGEVVSGFDTLEDIFGKAESNEFLRKAIPVRAVTLVNDE